MAPHGAREIICSNRRNILICGNDFGEAATPMVRGKWLREAGGSVTLQHGCLRRWHPLEKAAFGRLACPRSSHCAQKSKSSRHAQENMSSMSRRATFAKSFFIARRACGRGEKVARGGGSLVRAGGGCRLLCACVKAAVSLSDARPILRRHAE